MADPAQGDLLVPLALAAVAGYLLGSLPFGYLIARARGVNIFAVGSGSSGATNVRRVLGAGPGNAVFVLDVVKGAVAAGWPLLVMWSASRAFDVPHVLGYVGLAFALLGHSFSCFTRFRGGKGVATGAGGLTMLMPWVALTSAGLWVVLFYSLRFVSLASVVAALSLPLFAWLYHYDPMALGVAGLVAVFVAIMHRKNLVRLANGTEKRFERRKPTARPEIP